MGKVFQNNIKVILVSVFLYLLSFLALYGYSRYSNSKEYTLSIGTDNKNYRFSYGISKNWEEPDADFHYGTQCDFEVENSTREIMNNWFAEIELTGPCKIDSSWNGEFVLTGNKVIVTPLDYNDTVDPGEVQPFGMILIGPDADSVKTATIKYHKYRKMYDYALFYVLVLLGIICVCSGIVGAIYEVKNARLRRSHEEAVRIINQSYITFANMIDAKDKYTKGHSQRVAYYAREISRRLGFSEEKQNSLFYIALLHDIGKIGVQDAILKKTTKLTFDEFNEIKEHVSMGGDILKNFTTIEGIEDGARYHHEKYDGTGYMSGLKGKEIPIIARIICIADAFDAMSSARCYREQPLSVEKIIEELTTYSGSQFDPDIVPIMIDMINDGTAPIELSDDELEKEFSIVRAVKLNRTK